jgi:hypothetical protein
MRTYFENFTPKATPMSAPGTLDGPRCVRQGSIRADGRGEFPAYLFEVQSNAESNHRGDDHKLITTPSSVALRSLNEGCKFLIAA